MTDGALARATWSRDGDQLSSPALEIHIVQNRPSIVGEIHPLKNDERLLTTALGRGGHDHVGLSRHGWRWGGRENLLDSTKRGHRTLCQANHPPQHGQRF